MPQRKTKLPLSVNGHVLSLPKGEGTRRRPEPFEGGSGQPPRTRGGRRPGAGAPKGNLNSYKNGFDSTTIALAVLIIKTFPEVERLFNAIINTTDRARYRRLLSVDRSNRQGGVPLQDSIKADIAFALIRKLEQIREAEDFFANHPQKSKQSNVHKGLERFYRFLKKTNPDLYYQYFEEDEDEEEQDGGHEE